MNICAAGGRRPRRVVAHLVAERDDVLEHPRCARAGPPTAGARLANRGHVAPALEEQQRDRSALANGRRGLLTAALASGTPGAPAASSPAPDEGVAARRRAVSAASPAASARRSSVAFGNRRSRSLARQRMIASSSATATETYRDSDGGRRLR